MISKLEEAKNGQTSLKEKNRRKLDANNVIKSEALLIPTKMINDWEETVQTCTSDFSTGHYKNDVYAATEEKTVPYGRRAGNAKKFTRSVSNAQLPHAEQGCEKIAILRKWELVGRRYG